jgi:CubicO group peptidase (beta-lactamase class C family)
MRREARIMTNIRDDGTARLTGLTLPSCNPGESLGQCIDATVEAFMNQTPGVPGVIISAQSGGVTAYSQGYGVVQTQGPPPTAANSFQIDSLTKAFTAFSVLRLYEQQTIASLTDPIGKYMANLPNDAWPAIQIDQLLAMVSGIPDSSSGTRTYAEQLAKVARDPLNFTPGQQYQYSNSNYFLLGELINTLVGPSGGYMGYTKQQVLDVFGMPGTGLIPGSSAADPATPYLNGSAQAWRDPDCGYSAGGFASTMTDLEAFAIGLAGGLVLQPTTYKLMWTNYQLTGGGTGLFGLGWAVHTNADGTLKMVEKNGGGYGWSSAVAYSPPGASGPSPAASVCVLMNGSGEADALVNNILRKVLAANTGG